MIGHHYGVLLILGVSAFVGLFGAWFFQKIKVPQVVGYIAVGLLLGTNRHRPGGPAAYRLP